MKIARSLLVLTLAVLAFSARPAARVGAPGMSPVHEAPGAIGSAQAGTPACTVADDSCKEALSVGGFTFWYFRSYSLSMPDVPNPDITRAVIVIHGLQRNAGDYFTTVTAALHNDQDPSLVVIAPHFKGFVRNSPTCADPILPGELHWSCTGQGSVNRWDDGGEARDTGGDAIYSFSMIDRLITALSAKLPNLAKITIVGHSDGGQFTERYAAGNQIDGLGSVAIKYVVANPGSYMYVNSSRLPKGETCFESGTCTAAFTADWDPDLVCPDSYNNYKYGLASRTFGYMNASQPGFSDDELLGRFISRRVAYVMGEQDQLNNSQFDTSCPANAQGMHLLGDGSGFIGGRRERGTIFWNYVRQLGADHTLTIVPGCGHDEFCMFSAAEMVQAIIF